jgi:phosphate:Na+ symporter
MGVLIGTGLTMLIQSSAAIIGILQGLYAGHLLDLQGSIPILLGSNIGTCITAVLAAIGSNIELNVWLGLMFSSTLSEQCSL